MDKLDLLFLLEHELEEKRYSLKTIKTYRYYISEYFDFKKKDLEKPDIKNIDDFLSLKQKQNYSAQTINLYINVIRFLYNEVLKTKIDIKNIKKDTKIPIILTREEIKDIINKTKNKKHKLLLSLAYGSGLSVGEIVGLRVKDVDFDSLSLHIRGKKDRITVFPEKIEFDLMNITSKKGENAFVFTNAYGGALSIRTVQKIFSDALKRTGINKDVSFHSLRHSFAAHLMGMGVDINYIQKLLGYESKRSIKVYKYVDKHAKLCIKSPLE